MTAKQEGMMNKLTLRLLTLLLISALMGVGIAQAGTMNHRTADGKLKVLYHIDSLDLAVAKYAMALINKHIEAEGGPDKIDLVVVVHGPALQLFDKKTADPVLVKKLKMAIDKGAQPEMCQVSMKLFKKPLDALVSGFKPTEHPVAVKRIADLQEQGYLYIKP
jgi:intracellular sulfur oxidation DsrE/DsrF family protein